MKRRVCIAMVAAAFGALPAPAEQSLPCPGAGCPGNEIGSSARDVGKVRERGEAPPPPSKPVAPDKDYCPRGAPCGEIVGECLLIEFSKPGTYVCRLKDGRAFYLGDRAF